MSTLNKKELAKKYFGTEKLKNLFIQFNRLADEQAKKPLVMEEWLKLDLPYCAPEEELPSPLPTIEEIEAAYDTGNDITRRRRPAGYHVHRVRDYAIKFSMSLTLLQEGENMLFLEKNCQIRIPKVYALYTHQGGDPSRLIGKFGMTDRSKLPPYHYLVMEYIEGPTCGDAWDTLSETAQRNVSEKLGHQIRLLRSVPAPDPAYYGRIYGQKFSIQFNPMLMVNTIYGTQGPFTSHKEWVDMFYENVESACVMQHGDDFCSVDKLHLSCFQENMARAGGTEPVLTHHDLHNGNVMLQETADKENPDLVIIDWTSMAWMPAYMGIVELLGCRFKGNRDVCWEVCKETSPSYLDTAIYVRKFLEAVGHIY